MNTSQKRILGTGKSTMEQHSKQATDPSIGIIIDDAMEAIERDNQELGSIAKDFGNSDLSSRVLSEVVTLFGNLPSFGDEDARSKTSLVKVTNTSLVSLLKLKRKAVVNSTHLVQ